MTAMKVTTRTNNDVLLNMELINSILHLHYDDEPGHDYARIVMNNGDVWETKETYKELFELLTRIVDIWPKSSKSNLQSKPLEY